MTEFIKEIKDKLKDKKLAESSVNMYVRNIEKLNEDLPIKNLKFLENVDNILAKLEDYKPNTVRNYLISIVSVLSIFKDNKKIKKLHDEYYKHMIEKAKQIKDSDNNEKSETQKKNWMTWTDVQKRYDDLKQDVESFVSKKLLNPSQYEKLLALTILSFYVLLKPRRNKDIALLYITKKVNDNMPIDRNYIDYDNKQLIFNVYKTSKTYDTQDTKYGNDLQQIINMYVKHQPNLKGTIPKDPEKIFLVNYKGEPLLAVNAITNILNKIFDKKISSSMLRHIYLSDKYKDTLKEMKEDAKDMGHSSEMQKEYIKN